MLCLGVLGVSCEEDEAPQKLTPPSDLTISTSLSPEKPGEVTVAFSAQNTNFYRVWFGENTDEAPEETKATLLKHTYSTSGTFTIKVQAHATDAVSISKTQEVSVDLGEEEEGTEIPEAGYTTPESYDGMTLVWQDEFEGNALNTDNWTYEKGGHGWGNNELQYYREENTTVEEGYLIITAKKENYEGKEYTSSRLVTQGKQEFKYGRIDIRALLPEGQGIWPALWMLGANFPTVGWPASGEIDIMEMIGGSGRENQVHNTMHWEHTGEHASYGKDYVLDEGTFNDEFHVFSLVWDAETITAYVDDEQYNVFDITPEELNEFQQAYFLIFNIAVGGNWPGNPDDNTTFPQRMVVDYVRVFQSE